MLQIPSPDELRHLAKTEIDTLVDNARGHGTVEEVKSLITNLRIAAALQTDEADELERFVTSAFIPPAA